MDNICTWNGKMLCGVDSFFNDWKDLQSRNDLKNNNFSLSAPNPLLSNNNSVSRPFPSDYTFYFNVTAHSIS